MFLAWASKVKGGIGEPCLRRGTLGASPANAVFIWEGTIPNCHAPANRCRICLLTVHEKFENNALLHKSKIPSVPLEYPQCSVGGSLVIPLDFRRGNTFSTQVFQMCLNLCRDVWCVKQNGVIFNRRAQSVFRFHPHDYWCCTCFYYENKRLLFLPVKLKV